MLCYAPRYAVLCDLLFCTLCYAERFAKLCHVCYVMLCCQLREGEAYMLREQRAEAEELYKERAVRLEGLLEEWKTKYAALRRRFSLETEGFRRDADNIGWYCFTPGLTVSCRVESYRIFVSMF